MSGRNCSFASQIPLESASTSDTSSYDRSISPGDSHSQSDSIQSDTTPLTDASRPNATSPLYQCADNHQDPTLDGSIDLNHMELLIHLILDKTLFELGGSAGNRSYMFNLAVALNTGLESPYLLHQLLAFSARHLAFLHPEYSASYLHQAVALQTRAVSLFNATRPEVNRSNCVAILLFSSMLGHHLLADTLAKRDPGGLEAFMTHYIQCREMHMGIRAIALSAWPSLMETELEPVLSWSSGFTNRQPKGNHCQRIMEMVDGADGLGEEEKEACRIAVRHLQVGFDAVLAEDQEQEKQGNKFQMIVSWSMLSPPEFTGLLAVKRPEVLVLLGWYALLLHYGRRMWQVGDAGRYILSIIGDYLGPEWDHWLEYPRDIMARDFE